MKKLLLTTIALLCGMSLYSSNLKGTIKNVNGDLLTGAYITVTNLTTGTKYDCTSIDRGTYAVNYIKDGNYNIVVRCKAYVTINTTVEVKGDVTKDFVLERIKPQVETTEEGDLVFTMNGATFVMKHVDGGMCNVPEYNISQELNGFYMGETEVTQELWTAIMASNPSYFQNLNYHYGAENSTNRPVEKVSYEECQEFINILNELTGKQFKLPTKAEWVFAARGGVKSHGYKYAGSDNPEEVAWYDQNSGWSEVKKTIMPGYKSQQVKQKKPNELGLYDMSGNVKEWFQDTFIDGRYTYGGTLGGAYKQSARDVQIITGIDYIKITDGDIVIGLRLALTE